MPITTRLTATKTKSQPERPHIDDTLLGVQRGRVSSFGDSARLTVITSKPRTSQTQSRAAIARTDVFEEMQSMKRKSEMKKSVTVVMDEDEKECECEGCLVKL